MFLLQCGYSSPTQSEIVNDLKLSVSEVSRRFFFSQILCVVLFWNFHLLGFGENSFLYLVLWQMWELWLVQLLVDKWQSILAGKGYE